MDLYKGVQDVIVTRYSSVINRKETKMSTSKEKNKSDFPGSSWQDLEKRNLAISNV